MVLKIIKERVENLSRDFTIEDFSFGLPYSYVIVKKDRKCSMGVAMTMPDEIQRYENSFQEITVPTFINAIESKNIIERTLGLATINAISQYYINISGSIQMDIKEMISSFTGKIGIIGNMPPIVKALKEKNKNIYVFERNTKLWYENVLSDTLEYSMLPKMDIVLSTASVLVNNTIDLIIERSKNAKSIILIGATGQILPELFIGTGITHIASMRINTIEKARVALKMGDYGKFVNISRKYIFKILPCPPNLRQK